MLMYIKKIPLPIIAIFLALLTTGNLLLSHGNLPRIILGGLSLFLLLLFALKFIFFMDICKNDLKNPLIASVMPAFSMGFMVFSSYLHSYLPKFSSILWIFSVLLHSIFIIIFSIKYLINFNIKNLYPSWFIVYVGICTGAIVSNNFGYQHIGRLIFYFGFTSYLILAPLNIYRFLKVGGINESTWPTIGVFASPASLCLAAYINCFENKNLFIFALLLFLSSLTLIIILTKLPRIFESDFYPSIASFSFPIAISALAFKLSVTHLSNLGYSYDILNLLVKFEESLALSIVLYILIRYFNFILEEEDDIIENLDLDLD